MIRDITVKEWMSQPIVTVKAESSISEAHHLMKEKNIRRLVVLDKHDKLVGIVTIGDVREARPSDATTLSIWELNYLWSQLTVEKIMSRDVVTIKPDDKIVSAAEIMLNQKISGLPVVDAQNKVVGMLTESDVFRMLLKSYIR